MNRRGTRQLQREARRALSAEQQHVASVALARQVLKQPFYLRARHLAAYHAVDGEVDPALLLGASMAFGKHTYLPCLRPNVTIPRRPQLWFRRYLPGAPLRANRYGILEPEGTPRVSVHRLDVVFLPVVAFDLAGNRLGMGGGYYDRTLGFTTKSNCWRRPLLVGLAHDFQRVERIEPRALDVPLDMAVTDKAIYRFESASARHDRE